MAVAVAAKAKVDGGAGARRDGDMDAGNGGCEDAGADAGGGGDGDTDGAGGRDGGDGGEDAGEGGAGGGGGSNCCGSGGRGGDGNDGQGGAWDDGAGYIGGRVHPSGPSRGRVGRAADSVPADPELQVNQGMLPPPGSFFDLLTWVQATDPAVEMSLGRDLTALAWACRQARWSRARE